MLDKLNLFELALVFLAVWIAGCVIGHVLYKGGQRVYLLVQRRRQRRSTIARLKSATARVDHRTARTPSHPQAWREVRRPQIVTRDRHEESGYRTTSLSRHPGDAA